MNTSELLERYGAMLQLSQQMLECASKGDWDSLVELEQARSRVEEELRKNDNAPWPRKEGARKAEVIQSILTIDSEVSTLTKSWMDELRKVLGNIGVGKKMNKAYESI